MTETFISAGKDGIAVAAALADRLRATGIAVTCHGEHAAALDDEKIFAVLERADGIALLLTPGWRAETWPTIERYLARALRRPAGFLAKVALVDLSESTAAPAVLRPLLGGSIRISPSRAFAATSLDEMVALAGARRVASSTGGVAPRHVLVVGHPGSGKSTFRALLTARLRERGIEAATIDPYPFLQTLFRIDQLRHDTTRFESDALSEFLIVDSSALDESLMLTKARLSREAGVGRPSIVELAFADGPAMADIVSSRPDSIVVHVAASLEACRRNNETRGAIVRQRLRVEGAPAFDRLPSVHYVPRKLYEPYDLEPGRWEEGARRLAALAGPRYHRLVNEGRDLPAYLRACDAFIAGTLSPLLGQHRGDR